MYKLGPLKSPPEPNLETTPTTTPLLLVIVVYIVN
jgi:hypothetical protein